jgi:hypothetical protein
MWHKFVTSLVVIIWWFQDEIFAATQRFVILRDLSVKMACCSAGGHFEDSVMTVHYLPITVSPVSATKDMNGDTVCPHMTASDQVACPEGSLLSPSKTGHKEENDDDDDVDYYAYERKRKKHRDWRDRSSGVYDNSYLIKLLPLNMFCSLNKCLPTPSHSSLLRVLCTNM